MLRMPARLPVPFAGGVKVTLITHVLFGVTTAPLVHVVPLAMAKSDAFVPENDTAAAMFRIDPPVFFTVTVCAALVVVTS